MPSDAEVMSRLIRYYGGLVAAKRRLGVFNHQSIDNWRRRGIPASARPRLWAHCNSLAGKAGWDKLTVKWLVQSTEAHAARISSGFIDTLEDGDGRTRKKSKKQPPRKSATAAAGAQ
jgi:hypothetical protein